MNFAEKKKAYNELQGGSHLCCDRELLEKKAPKSPALKTGIVDKEKAQREILWALLDVATVEEIVSYRKPAPKKSEWIEKLVALITAAVPETIEGLKEADDAVCELLDKLEADGIELTDDQKNNVSAYKGYLSAAMIELRKGSVVNELIALDLQATTQPKLAGIARSLNIEATDFKKATLIQLLDTYRLNLPKESEGTGAVKTPVIADLDKVNELEAENEELKAENEDLQEQLEDAESEKEDIQEQLEEKKNITETQLPKKKTSIRELAGKILKTLTSSEQ